MTLEEYKEKTGYSYGRISRETEVHKSIIYRICTIDNRCIRLSDAHKIVKGTKGEVDYCDLLGDC